MRRLIPAALLVVLVLVIACGGGDDGPPPTLTSAPAGPTIPPLPTLEPRPTGTPVAGHPIGTRTSVAVIDAALEAVESGDVARLEGALSFHPYACDNQNAAGSNPCPPGVPVGTTVDTIAVSTCEARFVSQGSPELDAATTAYLAETSDPALDPAVYAAVELAPGRIGSPLPLKYMVIFASGHTLLLDDGGITHLGFPCEGVGPAQLFHPADTAILAAP